MYQRKVGVDILNAVKSVLADVSNVSPSSEQRTRGTATGDKPALKLRPVGLGWVTILSFSLFQVKYFSSHYHSFSLVLKRTFSKYTSLDSRLQLMWSQLLLFIFY